MSELQKTPSIPRRLACMLYEALVLVGIVVVAGFVFTVLAHITNTSENRHALQAVIFFVLGIYFIWSWSRGQTLPMKTWSIRIQLPNGNTIPGQRALLRYLLSWVWVLPPIIAADYMQLQLITALWLTVCWVGLWALLARLRTDRQFLHDAWAGTQLVQMEPMRTLSSSAD